MPAQTVKAVDAYNAIRTPRDEAQSYSQVIPGPNLEHSSSLKRPANAPSSVAVAFCHEPNIGSGIDD